MTAKYALGLSTSCWFVDFYRDRKSFRQHYRTTHCRIPGTFAVSALRVDETMERITLLKDCRAGARLLYAGLA